MTAEMDLQTFSEFDLDQATPSFWVFKKRAASGGSNPFTAVSVVMSDSLQNQLKELVSTYQQSHTIAETYTILSQPSEGGFLSISQQETLFPNLKQLIDRPLEECLATNEKQLNNAAGYVLRLRQDGILIYCVKKAGSDWSTRKKKGILNLILNESQLEVVDNPSFTISRSFDFFVAGNHVFMANKTSFESLLNHRITYEEAYAELKQESNFCDAISNFGVIDSFVGTNATHLRRMAVIKERGYYNDPNYMTKLRSINDLRVWGIQFDPQGRIVATEDKIRDIMHILLDHRLRSELSENQYDVPSTTPVS